MQVHSDSFWVQKAGNQENEYEDACWPRRPIRQREEIAKQFRFAVADGATETSFSRLWARLLVHAFGKGKISTASAVADLLPLQAVWRRSISKVSLPWYAEQKVRDGAFASLLGITLSDPAEGEMVGSWHALAVGDSCIVHVRGEQPLIRFPFHESSQFNSRPLLLSSNPLMNARIDSQNGIAAVANTWEQGDVFYLMTDALACWFMREYEAGQRPWNVLWEIDCMEDFDSWVKEGRDAKLLKNDDMTLLRVIPYW